MSRQFKYYLKFIAISFGILLLVTTFTYIYVKSHATIINGKKIVLLSSKGDYSTDNLMNMIITKSSPTFDINVIYTEKILAKTRSKIKIELSKYNFSHSGVRGLEDLLMESQGKPIMSVLFSSWSTGSTFFGQMLRSITGTYYYYEPLLHYGTVQSRSPLSNSKALYNIKHMLKCDFHGIDDYFKFGKADNWKNQFRQNKELWAYCKHNIDLCYDPDFSSQFCKLFPFQAMKLVRLRLRHAQELLDDPELNVRIILLVRDPRGLFNSRWKRFFCSEGLDCWQPELYCADMIRDYMTAIRLLPLYPDRLMVLRYEDLALDTHYIAHQVLKFLRLSATTSFKEFLKTHTNFETPGANSTYRIPQNVPFKWKYFMNFKDVDEIQMVCKEAMRMWGYRMVKNATQMSSKEFIPIDNYTIQKTGD